MTRSSDHLGDRVLDLDAGVHLHEVEAAVVVEQELHGAGVLVAGGASQLDRRLAHPRPQLVVERRRRRLLDQLLVPPLDRALALAEMHHVAVAVAEHLELDVPRLDQVLLQVDGAGAETLLRLLAGGHELALQALALLDDAHAAAAAARRRLEDHRVADLGGHPLRLLQVGQRLAAARQHRHPGVGRGLPRLGLVAHQPDAGRRRPDPAEVALLEHLGEVGVLGQEAVARVDGVGAGDLGRGDDAGDVEVALLRRRRPDADRLVGVEHVQRLAVGGAVDRHRLDAQLAAGVHHPQGDLAPVGHQDLLEHVARAGRT